MVKHSLRILRYSQRKIFKVCLVIFYHYVWKALFIYRPTSRYPDNWTPRKIAPPPPPPVRVGVWVKLTVRLELGATKQLPWRKIATRLGLGFGLGLVLGLAGEAMFLGGICPRTLQAIYSCFALHNYCELKKEKSTEAVRWFKDRPSKNFAKFTEMHQCWGLS